MIQALTVDVERIHQEMRESQARFREVQALREKSIQWLVNETFVSGNAPDPGAIVPRVSLKARKDRLTIHIQADSSDKGFLLFHTGAGGFLVQKRDSLAAIEYKISTEFPPPGALVPPQGGLIAVPKPDSARPRKPFKLDIN